MSSLAHLLPSIFLSYLSVPQYGNIFKYGKKKCNHPYPLERYPTEVKRLLGVLEKKLDGQEFLVGNEYSIADMAILPSVHCLDSGYQATEYLGLSNFPNVVAWKTRCKERPATAKGLTICPWNPRKKLDKVNLPSTL